MYQLWLFIGSSGKSTLFKQLRRIHGSGFTINELTDTLTVIRQCCVTGIIKLLQQSSILYNRDKERFGECHIDLDDVDLCENTRDHIDTIVRYNVSEWNEEWNEEEWNDLDNLGYALASIWKLDAIQYTYSQRGSYFSFPDNIDYFLDKVLRIMSFGYQVTEDDALKARVKTTGIIEEEFNIEGHTINIFDVGGQRSERKKWIHHFDGVTAVIFVAALNHFNAVLFCFVSFVFVLFLISYCFLVCSFELLMLFV